MKNNGRNSLELYLTSWFSKPWALFWAPFFCLYQLNFPPKWCYMNATSIWLQLVLNLNLKALGPIYGFRPIGMIHFVGPWTLVFSSEKVSKWNILWQLST
jgi:hypothetical protein